MLQSSVARFLEKTYDFDTRQALVSSSEPWSAAVWAQFAELGLLALPFAEEQGGLGGSIADCTAFAQSFGEHLIVEPYVSAIMLAGGALAASENPAAREWIGKLASGEAIVAFAYEEGSGTGSPAQIAMEAAADGDGVTLTGEKHHVIAGAQAEAWVVAACSSATGKLGCYLVDPASDGITAAQYTTIDGRSAANIRFDRVSLGKDAILLEDAQEALETVLAHAIIVLAAEAVGAMGALVRLTSEYAMTRKQFGQPIAMFQAVAHRLADMKIAHTKALSTLTYTAALANSGGVRARDISILKGQIGKLGRTIGEAAIQTHGGLGLTDELSVGHYHKRLIAFDAGLGDHGFHLRRLGAG